MSTITQVVAGADGTLQVTVETTVTIVAKEWAVTDAQGKRKSKPKADLLQAVIKALKGQKA